MTGYLHQVSCGFCGFPQPFLPDTMKVGSVPFIHTQYVIHSQPLASSAEQQYTFSNWFKATSTEIWKYLTFNKCI